MTTKLKEDLAKGFAEVINKHSAEFYSNTPDFILGAYLVSCLDAWNVGVSNRNSWYKRDRDYNPKDHIINPLEPNSSDYD